MTEELETQDSLTPDEELDSNPEEATEEVEQTDDEIAKAKEVAENQRIRAEKAEKELKALKQSKDTETSKSELSREEIVLIAKGMDDDDLAMLQKIQKISDKEVSLIEAQKDPLFVTYKKQKESEAKSKEASLGASTSTKFSVNKEGKKLTREEHKKLWEETMKNR